MRPMRRALAICLSIAITVAQACVAPSQGIAPSPTTGAPLANAPAAPSGAPDSTAALPDNGPPSRHIDTAGYHQDQSTSQGLTDYLTQHKLPLVGAQVLKSPDGTRAVVLYGFTGSDVGKQDAVGKARKYLNDSTVAVDNRIKVNPELLTANKPTSGAGQNPDEAANSSADPSAYPDAQSYTQHQNDAQQYARAQNNGASMSAMSPMLLMGLVALSIASGGMVSIGGGPGSMGMGMGGGSPFGGPPLGAAPYNPYPGYPSGSPSSPLGSP